MKLKFKYYRHGCQPNEVFPQRRSILRPYINIAVKYKNKRQRIIALLDTGSDLCLFPADLGKYLGISVENGKQLPFAGISAKGVAYFHKVTLEIGGWNHDCIVGFSPDMDRMKAPPVLGHEGFFDRYEVIFNCKKEIIEVKKSGTGTFSRL